MARSTDTWRRAVSLALAVLCFLAVPQVAQAVFKGQVKTSFAPVAVATLVTPSNFVGTYHCIGGLFTEGASVALTGFGDEGQVVGTNYQVRLVKGSKAATPWRTLPVGVHNADLSLSGGTDGGTSTYRVEVQALRGNWSGDVGAAQFGCGALFGSSGKL
jgi:hypothetical protein